MINKRLMIFAIFFISLLAISGVSASEIDSDIAINDDNMAIDVGEIDNDNLESADLQLDDNSDNKEMDDNENEENFKSSSNSELLTEDNPEGTFTDLANEIKNANGELNLTRNYVYTSDDDSYENGIIINKILTIDGNGYTINGNKIARAFNITRSNVIFKNIIFKSCYQTNSSGGAVYWSGASGSLFNCSFVNCSSSYGGAVFWSGASGSLFNCSFRRVHANFTGYSARSEGGAVYWNGTNGRIFNCSFVDSSVFANASGSSGSGYSSGGGAVFWSGASGSLFNCTFKNSRARSVGYSTSSGGGAVYWAAGNGSVFNCSFVNCSAGDGGSVYWGAKNGSLSNCSFMNCKSRTVYWNGGNGSVLNCNFVDGSSVYWNGGNGILSNCSFVNCNYSRAVYWNGNYGGNGILSNCSFVNCSSIYEGGAVLWYGVNNGNGILSNCSFVNCSSDSEGGAVYWAAGNGSVFNCSFVNCSSDYGGAAVYWYDLNGRYGENGTLSNCSFVNCSSDSEGGAVYWAAGNGSVFNCSFVNCSAGSEGGAVYWYGVNGSLSDSSFVNCNCSGAVYWYGVNGSLSDSSFVNSSSNYSSRLGGAVYWYGVNGSVLNCSFVNSSSDYVVNVTFNETDIYFDVNDIVWGDNITVGPIEEGATGILDIYVDSIYNTTINVDESIAIPFFVWGYHNITIIYSGDGYYAPFNHTQGFNVFRLNSTIAIEGNIEIDNSVTIFVTLNEDVTGDINISINNKWYSSTLENGVATFTVPNLAAGNYSVLIDYNGDNKYDSIYKNQDLEITLKKATLNFEIQNVLSGNNVVINPVLTSGTSGTLEIYVDDLNYATIYVGSSYTLVNPSIGKHEVKIIYSGDNYHESCENKTAFHVFSKYPIEFNNTAIIYGTGKHLQATFYDEYGNVLVNKFVAFCFNGTDNVVRTDENGVAIFDMDLEIGQYNVSAINTMVNEEKTILLNVFTSIVSQNMTRAYNTGIDYEVQLLGNDGKPLINGFAIFEVNGNNYTIRTNNNGMAILNIVLDIGTYRIFTINAETLENKTNTITIVPSIYCDDMIKTYNSGIDFQARFLDEYARELINQEISFTLNAIMRNDDGVFYVNSTEYNLTTDEYGIAILNTKIGVGEYEVVIHNKVTGETATRNLIILDRIIGNDDLIEVLGTNEYFVVTVLDDFGDPVGAGELVNVTFDDVSYEISTNANGEASFRIDESYGYHQISFEYKDYRTFNELYLLESIGDLMEIDVENISYNQDLYSTIRLDSYNPNAYVVITIDSDYGIAGIYNLSADDSIDLSVSNLDAGNYSIMAQYYDLQNFKYSFAFENFEVFKIDPILVLVVENATVGENATITVNIQQISGNITIKIGDERVYNEFIPEDGVIIKKINDLPIGEYQVEVTYNGNENYNVFSKSATLNITQGSSSLFVDAKDVYYGEDINVTVCSSVSGTVEVQIGENVKFMDVLANKVYYLIFENLDAGSYDLFATLTPVDSTYSESIYHGYMNVNKASPNLIVYAYDIEIGQVTNITATLRDGVTGIVNLELNGSNYTEEIIGGKAVFNIGGLELGNYTVVAYFDGNNNFIDDNDYATFKVTKVETIDVIDIPETMDDMENNFVIDLPSDATGTVTIAINGTESHAEVINGKVNITLPDLANGDYEYTITYSGDDKYSSFSKEGTLKINKVIVTVKASDMNVTFGGDYEFIATFYESDGSPLVYTYVTFVVNDKPYPAQTDSNGVALLNENLSPGNYTVTSINPRTGESVTNQLVVLDNRTPIDEGDIIIPPLNNTSSEGSVKISLPIDATGEVILTINGVDYEFPVVNGVATVKMPSLADGAYSYSITYSGDLKYSSFVKTGTVSIKNPVPTKIVASNISTVYNSGKYLVATLKDSKGNILKNKKVTIKLNGKTTNLTTNSYGQVKLLIKLAPKTYTAAISFAGDSSYVKSSLSIKVVVKKATPKLTAKAKTFKVKVKTKKYTITLKNNKGKVMKNIKVTLKVNGKTYKVKTNKKGVATFKITNLKKKGKYTAVITYAGSKYYKKVTKKPKITIKA